MKEFNGDANWNLAKDYMFYDWCYCIVEHINNTENNGEYKTTLEDFGPLQLFTLSFIEAGRWKPKPIPITREFLKENGFIQISEHNDEEGTMEKWFYPNVAYAYFFSDGEIEFEIIGYGQSHNGGHGSYRGIVTYIHKLQHILRDCGLEDIANNFKVKNKENVPKDIS